jgi:hypothetical protein
MPSPEVRDAYIAWEEGRYPEALEGYLAALRGPGGAERVEEIARLTGELHPVRQIDDDGRNVQVSPDGRYVRWVRGGGPEAVIRVARVSDLAPGVTVYLPDPFALSNPPMLRSRWVEITAEISALSATGHIAYVRAGQVRVRDLESEADSVVPLGGLIPVALTYARDGGDLYVTAGDPAEEGRLRILRSSADGIVRALDLGSGHASSPLPVPGGRLVVFMRPSLSPVAPSPPAGGPQPPPLGIGIHDLVTGETVHLDGVQPSVARSGNYLAYVRRAPGADGVATNQLVGLPVGDPSSVFTRASDPDVLFASSRPIGSPAVSPNGIRVAFQHQPFASWDIYLMRTGGGVVTPVTRDAEHDRLPIWLSEEGLLGMKGEPRHTRASVYDLAGSGDPYRLFHNNTLRTISPEYEWAVHPDENGVVVVADRDGDTISPERGVFWVDLTRTVSAEELSLRLRQALSRELALRDAGSAMYASIADEVRSVTEEISVSRIYTHAAQLHSFDSKFFTEPGNALAIAYLTDALEAMGYEVEQQWFEPRGDGVRSANVIATLTGTVSPEVVYVVSSHFDSVLGSPGADDNSSGTTALLEAARVLREHPRRATIQFAFLTAEEAGLRGAREFVRLAQAEGKRIVGVLNNDMVGWAGTPRLDDTVRYSNEAIRDIQHAAAILFSELITYDARYYLGTDAGVFYEAYGDIAGGIGSYPVLGNPNYHQPTDRLDTVNHRLVAEVSRTTVAAIMLLADRPARVGNIRLEDAGGSRVVRWDPSPETDVVAYELVGLFSTGGHGDITGSVSPRTVDGTEVRLEDLRFPGGGVLTGILVRPLLDGGVPGWEWSWLVSP